ncbi:hypothetical protein [Microbacterium sp. SSM24]|uniref:hypothetical protein n=1 Tax=Microbacterium sp. SSM24 TaxID=2991714 RepID=UPI002227C2F1|nr:hypothetical protein [Microbacterium sp. SSM24]MCW3493882.1 hypothetical protein [Microbacterium sp. SSM24]
MYSQVVVALGIVIATMTIGLVGSVLRRRAAVTGADLPTMPRSLIVTLLGVGVIVLLITVVGLLVVVAT